MPLADLNQWSTAEPYFSGGPPWMGELDQKRVSAYQLYEQIYWNVPETFALVSRGQEDKPIYVPCGKVIVDTLHRYMANDLSIIMDPAFGSDAERQDALQLFTDFARRERFYSKFSSNKREGIFRGDWLWHIFADPNRPPGSKISIFPLDPAMYFPIENEKNVDERIGCHIVEQYDIENTPHIRRLTYRKETGTGGPSRIIVSDQVFKTDEWGGPGIKEGDPVEELQPEYALPDAIDQLPVYHVQNLDTTGTPWGSSELRGLERIIAAVNQSISDEELALALEGIGVYVTNAGTPIDDEGSETGWNLGPGRVVEIPLDGGDGKTIFERVSGVSNVSPYQDHVKYLHGQIDEASGTPAISKGGVTVEQAESGVSLVMQLGPLLAKSKEKEQIVTDVHVNMLYDLRKWFGAYEQLNTENIRWMPTYGEKVPPNRKQVFDEVVAMIDAKIISRKAGRDMLKKVGYEFPEETKLMEEILQEMAEIAKTESDVEGARLDKELDEQPDEPDEEIEPVLQDA